MYVLDHAGYIHEAPSRNTSELDHTDQECILP